MYKLIILLSAIVCLLSCASLPIEEEHYPLETYVEQKQASTESMSNWLKQAAMEYQNKEDQISRNVFFNLAFPIDLEEYRAVQGMGVMYCVAITKKKEELPIKNIRFSSNSDKFELSLLIAKQTVPVNDEVTRDVFGQYREDYYIAFPYELTKYYGKILCDWNSGKTDFQIAKIPLRVELDYLENASSVPKRQLDEDKFMDFFTRQFPLTEYEDLEFFPE